MQRSGLVIGALAVGLLTMPGPAGAQRVSADIHIGGWPVGGHIRIGDSYGYYGSRPRPRPGLMVIDRGAPRIIIVERRRGKPWFFSHGYRGRRPPIAAVYYDSSCNSYFDRYHPGYERVDTFLEDGRYYRYDDKYYDDRYYDEYRRRYQRGHDDYNDDRDYRDRYPDRRYDRDYDRRYNRDDDDRR